MNSIKNEVSFSPKLIFRKNRAELKKIIVMAVFLNLAVSLFLAPLAALAAAGDIDTSFGYSTGSTADVSVIKVQPDGKFLINAHYNSTNNEFEPGLTRLNADGTPDATFQSGLATDKAVLAIAVLADAKVMALVAGSNSLNSLVRLNSNGSLDNSFQFGVSFKDIQTFHVLADGKILIGGAFSDIWGAASNNFIARLNSNGALDTTYPARTIASDGSRFGAGQAVSYIVPQTDGKFLIGGLVVGLMRLNADGTKDSSFNVNPVYSTFARPYTITSRAVVQADGKIIIAGVFNQINGIARNGLARLNTDGTLDTSFDVAINFDNTTLNPAAALAIQPDGKILVGGSFTTVNTAAYKSLVRLNPAGTIDTSFTPPTLVGNERVFTLALLSSNKILIGGSFKSLQGSPREAIARLEANGAVDSSFNAYNIVTTNFVNGEVDLTVLQPDGKIILNGTFTEVAGQPRPGLARLNLDGTLDTAFQPTTSYTARAIGVQPSGKVLLVANSTIIRLNNNGSVDSSFPAIPANSFYSFATQPDGKFLVGSSDDAARLVRYNVDGQLDSSFNAQVTGAISSYQFYYRVTGITVQADGKILIGGQFDFVSGQPRKLLARLNSNGTLDYSFTPSQNLAGIITRFAVQPDGKIWVGGATLNTNSNSGLLRLNSDGTLDTTATAITFNYLNDFLVQNDGRPVVSYSDASNTQEGYHFNRFNVNGSADAAFVAQADGFVSTVALYPNGKLLVGGKFLKVNNVRRNYLVRLLGDVVAGGFATQLAVTSTAPRANVGESVTFTTKVNPQTATGNVVFSEGTTVLATVPVANGTASYTTASLSVGLHKIKATYSGDANFNAGYTIFTQRIIQACGNGAEAMVVTSPTDDGTATKCSTFSFALGSAGGSNKVITFNLPDGGKTITLTGEFTQEVPADVQIDGGACGTPALVINGNGVGGSGLRLAGHNLLRNVQIKGFAATQTVTEGFGNRFECVRILGS